MTARGLRFFAGAARRGLATSRGFWEYQTDTSCQSPPTWEHQMKSISRRQFNRAAVAAATVFGTAPAFLRGQNLNSKLNIAMIGTGRRGAANTQSVGSENIVALCDVNSTMLDAAA